MAVIVTRSGKGAPLTNSELDSNFTNLNDGITSSVGITGGTIDGATIGATTPSTGVFTQLDVDNVRIDGNTVSTTNTNGDLTLDPNGTGQVIVDATSAVRIAAGTTLERPAGAAGDLRFNTDSDEFEGYNGTAWIYLGVGGYGYTSKTISENTTLNADTEYETGRNLRINFGVKLTVPNTTLLVVHNYATGLSL